MAAAAGGEATGAGDRLEVDGREAAAGLGEQGFLEGQVPQEAGGAPVGAQAGLG